MSRERALERRLRTLASLAEVIAALRSLSAQHFQAARARLPLARAYRDELTRCLAALDPPPDPPAATPTGIVLVGADLGLVGDYTGSLVREAIALRRERGPGPLVCLGERTRAWLVRAGIEPTAVKRASTSAAGITNLLLPLVDDLLSLHAAGAFRSLWLVAARFEGAGHYTPVRVPVLPLPAASGPKLPASPYADPERLRQAVTREYLYASLHETILEALCSEHGRRLLTTESARGWLDERIAATRRQLASIRRESATQEVLELASAGRFGRT